MGRGRDTHDGAVAPGHRRGTGPQRGGGAPGQGGSGKHHTHPRRAPPPPQMLQAGQPPLRFAPTGIHSVPCLWDNDDGRWKWRAQIPPEKAVQGHVRELQRLRGTEGARCVVLSDAAWQVAPPGTAEHNIVLNALNCVVLGPPAGHQEQLQHTIWRARSGLMSSCPQGVHTVVVACGTVSVLQNSPEQVADGLLQLCEVISRSADRRARRDVETSPVQILVQGLLPWPHLRGQTAEEMALRNERAQEVNRLFRRKLAAGDLEAWPHVAALHASKVLHLAGSDWASRKDDPALEELGLLRAFPAVFDLSQGTPVLSERGAVDWMRQLAGDLSRLWPGRVAPSLTDPPRAREHRSVEEEARLSQRRSELAAQLRNLTGEEDRQRTVLTRRRQTEVEHRLTEHSAGLKLADAECQARLLREDLAVGLPARETAARAQEEEEADAERRWLQTFEEAVMRDFQQGQEGFGRFLLAQAAEAETRVVRAKEALRDWVLSEDYARKGVDGLEERGWAEVLRKQQAAVDVMRRKAIEELRRMQHDEQTARAEIARGEDGERRGLRAEVRAFANAVEERRRGQQEERRQVEKEDSANRLVVVRDERGARTHLLWCFQLPTEQKAERAGMERKEADQRTGLTLREEDARRSCAAAAAKDIADRAQRRLDERRKIERAEERDRQLFVGEEQQERQQLRDGCRLASWAAGGSLKVKEAKRLGQEESAARTVASRGEEAIRDTLFPILRQSAAHDLLRYSRRELSRGDRVRPVRRLGLGKITFRPDKSAPEVTGEIFLPPTATGDLIVPPKHDDECLVKWDRAVLVQPLSGGAVLDCETCKAAREAVLRMLHKQKVTDLPVSRRWTLPVLARNLTGIPVVDLSLPRQERLGLLFVHDNPDDGRMIVSSCDAGGAAEKAGVGLFRGWQLSHANQKGSISSIRDAREAVQRQLQGARQQVFLRFHPVAREDDIRRWAAETVSSPGRAADEAEESREGCGEG
eukprot:Hpha_TRINITY_DN22950_c0_g1::TRINITY_DN22950_c0_g1_i1::g.154169::m.154169